MNQLQSENNKRIAKNTIFLYARTLFTMFIALFTSRIVLDVLGETDYGIYNVVGGVVAIFAVISGSLSAAVVRFITFELGKKNRERLKKVFSTSLLIHFALALFIFVLAETVGYWFLNNKMNIPTERMLAANWVLQCSILTFVVNIISVPYNALIIAHEKMKAFAYIGILEVVLKLLVAIALIYSSYDNLIVYAIALFLIALVIRAIYGIYCKKHFEESVFSLSLEKPLIKEISGFAGWNFIGASSAVLRDQGVNILINIFCGPAVNAARAISYQVNTAIISFVTNFTTALNPQIIKSYATKNYDYMFSLVERGARFSFYLLSLFALPVLLETTYILDLWLKETPEYSAVFVRLILIFSLVESLSYTLITAMMATGKIRDYQIIVGGLQLLNFPISYVLLKMGYAPEITILVAIFISCCCLLSRLIMLKKMIDLSISRYLKSVVLNAFVVLLFAAILPIGMQKMIEPGLIRFMTICIVSLLCSVFSIYYVGFSKSERLFMRGKVRQLLTRINRN